MQKIKLMKKELTAIYSHFNVGEGEATVVLVEDGKDLHYGVSFCAPSDNFSKKMGRSKATRRLKTHLRRYENGLSYSLLAGTFQGKQNTPMSLQTFFEFSETALRDTIKTTQLPGWVKGYINSRGR